MKAIRVYRHPDCSTSLRLAHRRRRLDWLHRIEDVAAEPPTGPLRLGEIAVQDLATGAIVRGADAVGLLCRHLPAYWWFLPLLHVPSVRAYADRYAAGFVDESRDWLVR
jgi:hypothetical protein